MSNRTPEQAAAYKIVAQAVFNDFMAACDRDDSLRLDYLAARDQWHQATDDASRDAANDAYAAVLMRFMEARGAGGFTEDEMDALRALRNRPRTSKDD
jgi:hypothetical protein